MKPGSPGTVTGFCVMLPSDDEIRVEIVPPDVTVMIVPFALETDAEVTFPLDGAEDALVG